MARTPPGRKSLEASKTCWSKVSRSASNRTRSYAASARLAKTSTDLPFMILNLELGIPALLKAALAWLRYSPVSYTHLTLPTIYSV